MLGVNLMNVAIGVCEKINGICTTMGCFKAFNNKEKHFKTYKKEEINLSSFFTCQICSSESKDWLNELADRFVKNNIFKVHIGVCIVKCKADKKEEIINIFQSKGIKLIEGTH